ncbi:MAG: leucyl/phenylalanyl-tRNA--protein transferase [Chitinophagaceae bacterium]
MPLFILDDEIEFPPVEFSEPDGLLAIGGDLSVARLITAYKQGIFPWYQGQDVLWWCPDPRFVLFPEELKISKSMKALLKKQVFRFTTNKAFKEVIRNCKITERKNQDGTWITDEVENAFIQLFKSGYAMSAEAWDGNVLAGGLYGVLLGKIFFGESMFSHQSNASKFAFIKLVNELIKQGIVLIDCQVHTQHLERLGARMIPRKKFIEILNQNIP